MTELTCSTYLRLRFYRMIWKNKNDPKCHMFNGFANDTWIHILVQNTYQKSHLCEAVDVNKY